MFFYDHAKAQRGKVFSTINYKRLTIIYSFATWFWQARNDCDLLCIGRSSQRKLRNCNALNIELQ